MHYANLHSAYILCSISLTFSWIFFSETPFFLETFPNVLGIQFGKSRSGTILFAPIPDAHFAAEETESQERKKELPRPHSWLEPGAGQVSGMLSHFWSRDLTWDDHVPPRWSLQSWSMLAALDFKLLESILSPVSSLSLRPKARNRMNSHGTLNPLHSTAGQTLSHTTLPRASPWPREEKHTGFMGFNESEAVRG